MSSRASPAATNLTSRRLPPAKAALRGQRNERARRGAGRNCRAFANAVLHLLEDGANREQLAHQGLAYINTYHDWNRIIQELIAIYQNAVQNN